MTDVELQPASLNDLDRYAPLMRACFGMKVPVGYFDWKYTANPAGPVVAFEAVAGEDPVGFYGVLPEDYIVAGESVRLHQSMDTMTHPDFQGRGLFTKLARRTYERLDELGEATVLLGIAGPNSLPGFVNKLGWQVAHEFAMTLRISGVDSLRLRQGGDFSAREVLTAGELAPWLTRRQIADARVRLELTERSLQWRVFEHPLKKYACAVLEHGGLQCGYVVHSRDARGRCVIEHYEFDEEVHLQRCTATMVSYLIEQTGARIVYSWQPTDPMLNDAYRSCGFRTNPTTRGPATTRFPLIVREGANAPTGVDWSAGETYALQPLMQQ